MTDHISTQGPFIVQPTQTPMPGFLSVCQAETGRPLAVLHPLENGQPNYADAAMFAATPHAIDCLIAIQELLMTSKEPVDLEAINFMISQVFEKIAAEADV
jgi:hypothetical protein